jgi:hypothetical protein
LFLDYGSAGNQGILDHRDNSALNEIPICFPCCFLHIVAIDNLKKINLLSNQGTQHNENKKNEKEAKERQEEKVNQHK